MADNNQDFIQVLLEKIEKDDLPTNVFDVEGTDPLVLLGKMNEIIGQLENFQSSVNASNSTANEALSKAEDAVDASEQALSNANTALGTANQAIGTANTAIETANQSLETANEAKGIAETANQNSGQAVTTANEAKSTAENALEQVTQGLGTKVYDNSGNLLNETTFEGSNGINVDMDATSHKNFVISIDQQINDKISQNETDISELQSVNNALERLIANIVNNTTKIKTSNGGFSAGNNASAMDGGAIGNNASAHGGGAVGSGAITGNGFAGGVDAKAVNEYGSGIDAIQLGRGTNTTEKSLKIYNDNIYNASTHTLTVQNATVGGNEVDTIEEQGTNYIRYSNGIQICWGRMVNTTGTQTINFQPFINANYSVAICKLSTSSSNVNSNFRWLRGLMCYNLTTTSFQSDDFNGEAQPRSWLAIGRWK